MEEATIYYLNWDEEARERAEDPEVDEHPAMGPAGELHHKLSVKKVLDEDEKPSMEYSEDEFDELYREVETVEGSTEDDLGQLWKEWNAGSRQESQEFYEAEVRSMSVGDVIESVIRTIRLRMLVSMRSKLEVRIWSEFSESEERQGLQGMWPSTPS